MTGPLKNARRERYAQERAKGKAIGEAYADAGFSPNAGNAGRLDKEPDVAARVLELQQRAAEKVELTVASVTSKLLSLSEKAEGMDGSGALNVARQCLMDAAKLNGLVVDSSEVVTRSPEDRAARLAALKAERERIARPH